MSGTAGNQVIHPASIAAEGQLGSGDALLPPAPWTWTDNGPFGRPLGTGFVYLHDATGRKIGTVWGTPDEKVAIANMICDARDQIHSQADAPVD